MYSARKAAQMAAFFAKKSGGQISTLKLTKLLYLADRESIKRYGLPISFDNAVSMPHGPVLTRILNLTNGESVAADQDQWDEWIGDRENHFVSLNRGFEVEDLDQLSDADIEVMSSVWETFGPMTPWQLRDYTHENLPEWQDPNGSMIPISDEDRLLAILGDADEASALAEEIEAMRKPF